MVVIGGVSYKTSSNKLTKAKTPSTEKESGKNMTSLSTKKLGESFFALVLFSTVNCLKLLQQLGPASHPADWKQRTLTFNAIYFFHWE